MRVAAFIAFLLWAAIVLVAASHGVHGLGLAFIAVAATVPGGLLVGVVGMVQGVVGLLNAWADSAGWPDDDAGRPPG